MMRRIPRVLAGLLLALAPAVATAEMIVGSWEVFCRSAPTRPPVCHLERSHLVSVRQVHLLPTSRTTFHQLSPS